MKWLALLGVIVGAGAAALFMRGSPAPPPEPGPTAALPASTSATHTPAPAPKSASTLVASSVAPWRRIELRGVLFQQNDPAASQALLSQDGGRARLFHSGEQVLQGWTLQSIRPDHVIVANGAEQHRLEVAQAASAPAQAPPAMTASATQPAALPGFIPAPPGQGVAAPPSLETNRRFLQDRRNRAASAAQ